MLCEACKFGDDIEMANILKSTRSSCNNLFNHYERKKGVKFSNQEIDESKSYKNYNLGPSGNQNDRLNKRLSEVKVLKRDDVNVLCNWVITLPKRIEKDTKEEDKFFKEVYKFLLNRYGEKNVISAYVHKDETTPHMHYCFVPVVKDKKKNIEKVSAFELISRKELKTFHQDLSNYINKVFNRDIEMLNGATANGNKTVLELKNEKLEKEINKKEMYLNILNKSLDKFISDSITKNGRENFYRYLLNNTNISKKDILEEFKDNKINGISVDDESIGIFELEDVRYYWEYEKNNKPTREIPSQITSKVLNKVMEEYEVKELHKEIELEL